MIGKCESLCAVKAEYLFYPSTKFLSTQFPREVSWQVAEVLWGAPWQMIGWRRKGYMHMDRAAAQRCGQILSATRNLHVLQRCRHQGSTIHAAEK